MLRATSQLTTAPGRPTPDPATAPETTCVGPSFVITVRQGVASDLHDARLRLEQHPELLKTGTTAVLWAILDTVVDGYAPVVEGLERDIEEVEKIVFAGDVAPTERIYSLRREVTDFYRAVHPLLAPLEGVERGAFLAVASELGPYFRDVRDHLRLVNEEVTAQRPAADVPGGEHGRDLRRADEDQRPTERLDQAAHDHRHGVLAADCRHGVLRPELRVAGRPHRHVVGLRRVRDRRPGPPVPAAVRMVQSQRLHVTSARQHRRVARSVR
jgi:CorA-like Mg2+ transporter protein